MHLMIFYSDIFDMIDTFTFICVKYYGAWIWPGCVFRKSLSGNLCSKLCRNPGLWFQGKL